MKEKSAISAFGWSILVGLLLFVVMSAESMVNSIVTMKAVNKINLETESVRRCEEQNRLFWDFVANVDDIEDNDALVARRDSLYDKICEF